ncbi:MAG: DUF4878 domain-containing protein [Bacteroidetes bacterium]|nr:DUF4878 domain-containing protein [Bacteroidota bacterium]
MKNTLKLVAIALVAVFVVACAGSEGPEPTAKAYLDAISAKDFDKAKEYSTEESKAMLDMLKQFASMGGEQEKSEAESYSDLKCTVSGDTTAVCTYKAADKEESLNLKKADGKWLVHQPKENPMGEGGDMMEGAGDQMMEGAGEMMEEGAEMMQEGADAMEDAAHKAEESH